MAVSHSESRNWGLAAVADGNTLTIIPCNLSANRKGANRTIYEGCRTIQEEEAALKAERRALGQLNNLSKRERDLERQKQTVYGLIYPDTSLPNGPFIKLGHKGGKAEHIQKLIRDNPHMPVSGTLARKVEAVLQHLDLFKYDRLGNERTVWKDSRDTFLEETLKPYSATDREAIRTEISKRGSHVPLQEQINPNKFWFSSLFSRA